MPHRGVSQHGVVVGGWVEVAGKTVETGSYVDDEEYGVVLVEAFPWEGICDSGGDERRGGEEDGGEGLHGGRLDFSGSLWLIW